MYHIDTMTERFETVEILKIPGLFTTMIVDRATVPPGMYAYDMQSSADDWSQPGMLTQQITERHYGTVLTASPITLPKSGYLKLNPGDFDQCTPCEGLTVCEFEENYLSPHPAPCQCRKNRAHSVPAR